MAWGEGEECQLRDKWWGRETDGRQSAAPCLGRTIFPRLLYPSLIRLSNHSPTTATGTMLLRRQTIIHYLAAITGTPPPLLLLLLLSGDHCCLVQFGCQTSSAAVSAVLTNKMKYWEKSVDITMAIYVALSPSVFCIRSFNLISALNIGPNVMTLAYKQRKIYWKSVNSSCNIGFP